MSDDLSSAYLAPNGRSWASIVWRLRDCGCLSPRDLDFMIQLGRRVWRTPITEPERERVWALAGEHAAPDHGGAS